MCWLKEREDQTEHQDSWLWKFEESPIRQESVELDQTSVYFERVRSSASQFYQNPAAGSYLESFTS